MTVTAVLIGFPLHNFVYIMQFHYVQLFIVLLWSFYSSDLTGLVCQVFYYKVGVNHWIATLVYCQKDMFNVSCS